MLAGCAGLKPPEIENLSIYMLDARPAINPRLPQRNVVLAVGTPRAWPGFDTPRIAYVRQLHELDYFATGRWADAPARMLGPLIAHALEQGGGFRAVVHNPSVVASDVRLDTELVRLQHEFLGGPSRVRIALRAQLIDTTDRRVIGAREFEEMEPAAADNVYSGVAAANRALERVLTRLAEFCANTVAGR
jgi:cholesterol transport system auxiliary component